MAGNVRPNNGTDSPNFIRHHRLMSMHNPAHLDFSDGRTGPTQRYWYPGKSAANRPPWHHVPMTKYRGQPGRNWPYTGQFTEASSPTAAPLRANPPKVKPVARHLRNARRIQPTRHSYGQKRVKPKN